MTTLNVICSINRLMDSLIGQEAPREEECSVERRAASYKVKEGKEGEAFAGVIAVFNS